MALPVWHRSRAAAQFARGSASCCLATGSSINIVGFIYREGFGFMMHWEVSVGYSIQAVIAPAGAGRRGPCTWRAICCMLTPGLCDGSTVGSTGISDDVVEAALCGTGQDCISWKLCGLVVGRLRPRRRVAAAGCRGLGIAYSTTARWCSVSGLPAAAMGRVATNRVQTPVGPPDPSLSACSVPAVLPRLRP